MKDVNLLVQVVLAGPDLHADVQRLVDPDDETCEAGFGPIPSSSVASA